MKWHPFSKAKGFRQKRPPEKKAVLVLCERKESNLPNYIAIGYRKNAAGDKSCPYFVVPGLGGIVLAWCDGLAEHEQFGPWMKAEAVVASLRAQSGAGEEGL